MVTVCHIPLHCFQSPVGMLWACRCGAGKCGARGSPFQIFPSVGNNTTHWATLFQLHLTWVFQHGSLWVLGLGCTPCILHQFFWHLVEIPMPCQWPRFQGLPRELSLKKVTGFQLVTQSVPRFSLDALAVGHPLVAPLPGARVCWPWEKVLGPVYGESIRLHYQCSNMLSPGFHLCAGFNPGVSVPWINQWSSVQQTGPASSPAGWPYGCQCYGD